MKKQRYLLSAAIAMALAGCSDDLTEKITNPVQTGEEIVFGSSISKENQKDAKGVQVKTIYGNRTESGIPVHWDPNGDAIAIFCPQASAPARKLVNYVVKPDTDQPMEDWNTSAWVEKEKLEEAGLQWGSEPEHEFYALYPAEKLINADKQEVAQAGILTANVPVSQDPTRWESIATGMGNTYFALPNMDNAYMWAHNHVSKDTINTGSPIYLQFKNLVTVLDITIPGPENNEEVTLTNISIESETPGDILTGDFNFYIKETNDNDHNQGYVEPIQSDQVRNRISISCWNDSTKSFIKLKKGTYAVVKAYLVPVSQKIQNRTLKISVSKLNGGAPHRKTLEASIVPQKINRIVLPEVYNTTTPDNWMSSLDPDIYLSELSVPGSKFSYLTSQNKANPPYQTKDIQGQFKDGVRAFIVQTGSNATFIEGRTGIIFNDYSYKIDPNKSIEMPVTGAAEGTTLEKTISDISDELKSAPDECAFVILTCNGGDVKFDITKNHSGSAGNELTWPQAWIETLEVYLKELAKRYPIYNERITANTTIGDVRGKIIIKVNYNDASQEKFIDPNANIPALFSIWINPKDHATLTPTASLRWGSPNKNASYPDMNWMHVEATNVGHEVTVDQKKNSITNMFKNAVDIYLDPQSKHDTFFMTDIGGIYTASQSTTQLAEDMNFYAVQALQNRKENASTGLIFMNFADRDVNSGQKYKSDWIISTIIDNNFKFALRKRPSAN